MLVITQKEGEILQIGPDIRIMIRRAKGGWVRFCIDAPRSVDIQRIAAPEPVEPEESNEIAVPDVVLRRKGERRSS